MTTHPTPAALVPPDTTSLATRAASLRDLVTALPPREQYAAMIPERRRTVYGETAALLERVTALARQIDDTLDPNIRRWHEGHKAALAEKRALVAPLEAARAELGTVLVGYDEHEEHARRVAEAAAAAEAQAAEDDERLAEAMALDAAGDHAGAADVLDGDGFAPRPVVGRAVPKAERVHVRATPWRAEVTDLAALVAAIAAGTAPLALVTVDQRAANQLARACNGALEVPGLRAVRASTVAVNR